MSSLGDNDVFDGLRRLAAENPRAARDRFCELLDSGSPSLGEFLRRATAPGEGRLRQLVANAVRTRPGKDKLIPHLFRWLEAETDEFAKRAIAAALEDVDLAAYRQAPESGIADPKLVEAYRYVRDRLCHEFRTTLLRPRTGILRLKGVVESIGDEIVRADLSRLLGELTDAFQVVGRIVEFDPDDDHFKIRSISILGWLQGMNRDYGQKYEPIDLSFENHSGPAMIRVLGSDYLLRTIFWNLWINSHQAIQGACKITIRVSIEGGYVNLVVIDNGSGFPKELFGVVFHERYSRNGAHRGRGLLEVQAAVKDLHGNAKLVEVEANDWRVLISFPLESAWATHVSYSRL